MPSVWIPALGSTEHLFHVPSGLAELLARTGVQRGLSVVDYGKVGSTNLGHVGQS